MFVSGGILSLDGLVDDFRSRLGGRRLLCRIFRIFSIQRLVNLPNAAHAAADAATSTAAAAGVVRQCLGVETTLLLAAADDDCDDGEISSYI